ncbi:hypothetical protein JTE90_004865 [Oedothorax gibbosus]|uniref:Uncharacterized protein n=1 Tax=Oedothorax gibbosus TaxID=931172 RepID=A0AAV6UTJ6_9ARAC|nr:hypothetical protein JTE90_004865 [Oedothorax gibbosus]
MEHERGLVGCHVGDEGLGAVFRPICLAYQQREVEQGPDLSDLRGVCVRTAPPRGTDCKGKWSRARTSLICVVCVCELPLLAVPTGNFGKSFRRVPRANAVLGTYTHPLGMSSPYVMSTQCQSISSSSSPVLR